MWEGNAVERYWLGLDGEAIASGRDDETLRTRERRLDAFTVGLRWDGVHPVRDLSLQPRTSRQRREAGIPVPWLFDEPFASDTCAGEGPNGREGEFRVLFIHREDYLPHPRSSGRIEHRLENADEVVKTLRDAAEDSNALTALARDLIDAVSAGTLTDEEANAKLDELAPALQPTWPPPWDLRSDAKPPSLLDLANRPRVVVIEGKFARASMREQIEEVRRACLIVAAHGAALTHVLFARPGTRVLEVQTVGFFRPHFIAFSLWAGADYSVLHSAHKGNAPPVLIGPVARAIFDDNWYFPRIQ
jgi:hypothetical protein